MTHQPPNQPAPGQYPQGQPYYGQPPKKKSIFKRVWFWLIVIAVLGLGGCAAIVAAVGSAVDDAQNAEHTVVYEVTGDGTKANSVTYTTINGDGTSGSAQDGDVPLPYSKQVTGKGDFSSYSLVGQAGDGTTISCKVTIDGKVIAEQTSTGQYAVVTCAGSPPKD